MIEIENLSWLLEEAPYGSTDWVGTRMILLEDAHNDNIFLGCKEEPCFAARAVNADDRDKGVYKCIWLDTPPEGMPEYYYEDPDNYIDWDNCDDVIKIDEYYPDEED